MWAKLFDGNELLGLPVLSMLLFIGVFIAVVIRVMSKQRRGGYESASMLPLEDDPLPRDPSTDSN
mgnify:CR=1 FL=1